MGQNIIQVFRNKLINNIEKVIIGKTSTLDLVIISLICGGNILIEDFPGVGKTIIAKSIAISLGCNFQRIQFTPDMLPSDVTGVTFYNQLKNKFEFRPGPIMAEIVLADEINRATPKTQSALLEAMEERQITADGITHKLPDIFMVIGTQNPIEYEGTFPLPEAQLDRFLMRISIGYPNASNEIRMMDSQQFQHPIESLKSVTSATELKKVQKEVKKVHVSTQIKKYILEIIRRTREHEDIYLGSSPRGSLGLYKAGQAHAALDGRDFVIPDDITSIAEVVLSHRILLQTSARIKNLSPNQVVQEILREIPIIGIDNVALK